MNVALARLLLSVAYPLLAHLASAAHDPRLAALALLDIVLILLVLPLARRDIGAWLAVGIVAIGLYMVQGSALLPVLLLLPPVLFPWLVAWWFARTLRPGSVPLISRIVGGLERCAPEELEPRLKAYTRGLTTLWAVVLTGIGVANLALGLIAVPDGLLVHLGHPPVVSVPQVVWSWCANLLDYGVAGLIMVVEYLLRLRLFPDRPYRDFPDFIRRLGALGPAFWRDVMR
ncbi:ketosynthase [Cognatilysobacter lacus]|uniref:Ketosynthase n=1 Tax=Cognatilysobacter lacus TaxID=1643323 RepID=A0A5D8YYR6_9GAMM|nr:ketosynthase [Lysobacter lacus]TZF87865.1 ketosynthase [Lysobacter lacus]